MSKLEVGQYIQDKDNYVCKIIEITEKTIIVELVSADEEGEIYIGMTKGFPLEKIEENIFKTKRMTLLHGYDTKLYKVLNG